MVHQVNDFHSNYRLVGKLLSADMNSTADQLIPIGTQSGLFKIESILVTNASVSLTTAVGGIYLAASKAGSPIVANSQVFSALTAAGKYVQLTLANSALTDLTDPAVQLNWYLSLTTGQGVAATADFYFFGKNLHGNAA